MLSYGWTSAAIGEALNRVCNVVMMSTNAMLQQRSRYPDE
jgi:hypothetical protein